ncbi:MAG TPA: hypothetical protein VJR89_14010, partial [Polyangiales bacterium]|nr:hypothetical protein [Polyangiales bacterium]
MKAPPRLLEDPQTAPELWNELQRTAASSVRYDVESGLAGLQARLQVDATPAAAEAAVAPAVAKGASVVLKLTLLAAVGGGVALATHWVPEAPQRAPATPQVADAEPRAQPAEQPTLPAAPAVIPAPSDAERPERDAAAALRREITQLASIRAL